MQILRLTVGPILAPPLTSQRVFGDAACSKPRQSVPFFADPMPGSDREDKWSGFTKQRGEVLDLIRQESIQAWYSWGVTHFSLKSELISPDKPHFRVLSVVSSAFLLALPTWKLAPL